MIRLSPLWALSMASLAATAPAAAQAPSSLLGKIRPEWISAHVRFLSDRLLEGRETGARGAELAAKYVAAEFEEIGLEPLGKDSSFLSPVPLRYSDLKTASLTFTTKSGARQLELERDFLVHPDKQKDAVKLEGGIVFVGWGVSAPDLGYDDYRGVDAKGKFVVTVFGGPTALPPDERGYYAALATKEQTAFAHGAIGVITLLPAPGAVVKDKVGQLEGFAWLDTGDVPRSVFFEKAATVRLTDRGTAMLLEAAGHSLAEVTAALAKGPFSFPIDGTLSLEAQFIQQNTSSPNVIGLLEGADPKLKHEYVVYSAHLDHVGVRSPVDGDSVYHGAIDNAGGTAVMMGVAQAYTKLPRPKRSILFVAVTGEEKGILGSDYFAHHPPVPASSIVADVNLDNFVITHPFKDLTVYGAKYSSLDADAAAVSKALGVGISDDPLPWMTIFTRSDHYTFMRVGIPSVMFFPGKASGRDGKSGVETQRYWFDHIHHTPRDRIDQGIDWKAAARYGDANLLMGYRIANRANRPTWKAPNYFFREKAE
jgi:Zn-dependent M28 family amino/carboxypeptidase